MIKKKKPIVEIKLKLDKKKKKLIVELKEVERS